MNRAVLCDVDGTVALMGKGDPARRGPFEWDRVGEDDPVGPIIALVDIFRTAGYEIVFVSGRDESCRTQTFVWLRMHGAIRHGEQLLMRAEKDNRPDDDVKTEIYERWIKPRYRVAYVLDDRDRVVRRWRELGLTCLQVAPGDF